MARRRKKSWFDGIYKPLFIVAAVGLGLWYIQNHFSAPTPRPVSHPKPVSTETSSKPAIPETKSTETESKPESKPESTPTTKPYVPIKPLTDQFPQEAWLDDYLKIDLPMGTEQTTLVAVGLAPTSSKAEKIRDPEKLKPALLFFKKEGEKYTKLSEFRFGTENQKGEASTTKLKGIPRIQAKNTLDLDKNGKPEILVFIDSSGTWPEAAALLQYKNGKLDWVKIKDATGKEKLALWEVGRTPTQAQHIKLENSSGSPHLLVRKGGVDSSHPEKGLSWKNSVWIMKDGVLQEKK